MLLGKRLKPSEDSPPIIPTTLLEEEGNWTMEPLDSKDNLASIINIQLDANFPHASTTQPEADQGEHWGVLLEVGGQATQRRTHLESVQLPVCGAQRDVRPYRRLPG